MDKPGSDKKFLCLQAQRFFGFLPTEKNVLFSKVFMYLKERNLNLLFGCYATLHPAMSIHRLVGQSVGRSPIHFFGVF